MRKEAINRLLHQGGSLLAILGLGYLVYGFWSRFDDLQSLTIRMFWVTLILAMVYAASNIFLAMSWRSILVHLNLNAEISWLFMAYGSYQITKYVPGNVANILGRQSLGIAAGLPAWPLARSTIWEIGLLAASALIYATLFLPHLMPSMTFSVAGIFFVMVSIAFSILLFWIFGRELQVAQALQALFLMVSSLSFVMLLRELNPSAISSFEQILQVLAIFNIAWLIGMVTPGAPAGIGVRESLIVTGLGGLFSVESLLLAVMLSRVVSVLGDLVFWLMTVLMRSSAVRTRKN